MNSNQIIKINGLKNLIIIVLSICSFPYIKRSLDGLEVRYMSDFLMIVSILLVSAGFGNFAFTYGKIDIFSKKVMFLGHIISGALMLMYLVLLISLVYGVNLAYPAISFLIGGLSLIMYIGLIAYDFWDLFKIDSTNIRSKEEEQLKFQFLKTKQILHSSAQRLKTGRTLQVANYYIGECFYALYGYLNKLQVFQTINLDEEMLELSIQLKTNPFMSQPEADKKANKLIQQFLLLIKNHTDEMVSQTYNEIKTEANILVKGIEDQHMVDTRFAKIFEGIIDLIDIKGESLFTNK